MPFKMLYKTLTCCVVFCFFFISIHLNKLQRVFQLKMPTSILAEHFAWVDIACQCLTMPYPKLSYFMRKTLEEWVAGSQHQADLIEKQVRVISHWNKPGREVKGFPRLDVFKSTIKSHLEEMSNQTNNFGAQQRVTVWKPVIYRRLQCLTIPSRFKPQFGSN